MISIIGAGPAGSYTAHLLSKKGYNVTIFEEHNKIGLPLQCAGIVTDYMNKIIKLDSEIIQNKLKYVEIVSPYNKTVKLPSNDIVIDRVKFDMHLANLAKDSGAQIITNARYINNTKQKVIIKRNNTSSSMYSDIIIGADGPLSQVAKINNMFGNRKFYYGIQARVEINCDPSTYKVFFGDFAKKFFAWQIPESDKIARVGLATLTSTRNEFNYFLKKLGNPKVIDMQGGLIPIYDPKQNVQKENIFLIGDAATQVKASTGGGIIQGMMAGKILTKSIITKTSYKENLSKLNKDLMLHLRIRNYLNKFSPKDYDSLISLCAQKRIQKVLRSTSRDEVFSLGLKLLMLEPRFLRFLKI